MLNTNAIQVVLERMRPERVRVLARRLGDLRAAEAAGAEVEWRLRKRLDVLTFERADDLVRWLRSTTRNVATECLRPEKLVLADRRAVALDAVGHDDEPRDGGEPLHAHLAPENAAPGVLDDFYLKSAEDILLARAELRAKRIARGYARSVLRKIAPRDYRLVKKATRPRAAGSPRTATERARRLRARCRAQVVVLAHEIQSSRDIF